MKKLLFLLITVSFLIGISSVNAFASEPAPDPMDRHAVWTNTSTVGKGGTAPMPMTTKGDKGKTFDFIRETKSYEYNKNS